MVPSAMPTWVADVITLSALHRFIFALTRSDCRWLRFAGLAETCRRQILFRLSLVHIHGQMVKEKL